MKETCDRFIKTLKRERKKKKGKKLTILILSRNSYELHV